MRRILVLVLLAVLAAPATASAAKGKPGGGSASTGYDVSYPQCGGALPRNPAFGIVGANNGRPFNDNPCFAGEWSWAAAAPGAPGVYMNTANPGTLSTHWGEAGPRTCNALSDTDPGCAYNYGWNAAAEALAYTGSAGIGRQWWLDVETANSWSGDTSLNATDLQGSVDYLTQNGASGVGIYSTSSQWSTIAGGTAAFATLPNWVAGGSSARQAQRLCTSSFTGGPVRLVQYPSGGFDADLTC